MKNLGWLGACGVLCAGAAWAAWGFVDEAPKPKQRFGNEVIPAPTNAAPLFYRAWARTPKDLMAMIDAGFNGRDLGWAPVAELANSLDDNQWYVRELVRAAKVGKGEWSWTYDGQTPLLPQHALDLRGVARVLVSDCRRHFDAGRVEQAVERAEALFMMSRLMIGDRLLHSANIGMGFTRMAGDEVKRMSAKLSPEHRRRLLDAMAPSMGTGAFGHAEAIRVVGAIAVRDIEVAYVGPGAGDRLFQSIQQGGEPQEIVEAIRKMDGDALREQAERVRDYYALASEAWTEPNALGKLREYEGQILDQKHGPLAVLVAPGFGNLRQQVEDNAKFLEEIKGILEGK